MPAIGVVNAIPWIANLPVLVTKVYGTNINATNIKPGTYYFIIEQGSLGAP